MLCGQMSKHSVVKHRQIFLLGLVWVLEHHCNSEHDRKKVEALPTPPPLLSMPPVYDNWLARKHARCDVGAAHVVPGGVGGHLNICMQN
jgi:hypothetical protein